MPRKKQPEQLPKYVHIKNGEWYVGLNFPTGQRRANGSLIYEQFARRCAPETSARASEIVEEIKASYLASLERGKKPLHQSLVQFLETFLAAKQKSVERRTFEFYTEQFDWHVKESAISKQIIETIKPLEIQQFYDELQGNGISSDAIRKLHQFLSAAFNQAVVWDVILKNPARGVILPKKGKPDVAAMSKSEARRFIEICRQSEKNIVFEFALETAMRPEEYLALTWDDVDLETRVASVHRAVAVGFKGGGFEFKATKTRGSERVIAFSGELANRLKMHRAAQMKIIAALRIKQAKPALLGHKQATGVRYEKRLAAAAHAAETLKNYREHNLIFPSLNGKPQSRLNLNRRHFKAALKAAALDEKKFSLYSLRRTAATILASKINPKELASFLGHTDVTTAMKYYVMVTEDSKYKATDALSAMLY